VGLDVVELIMELENEFGIELPAYRIAQVRTVGALFQCVQAELEAPEGPNGGAFAGPAWERYLTVVARELGVDRLGLHPEARFVDDLHAD
jgi:acyl carrier protein